MKKYASKIVLSSLLLLPITSLALSTYSSDTGYLDIPEVKVDGNTFYDNVGLKLNFTTGTFELISGDARPEPSTTPTTGSNFGAISTIPIESKGNEDIKLDFMGCERSGDNTVICHVNYTSLGTCTK